MEGGHVASQLGTGIDRKGWKLLSFLEWDGPQSFKANTATLWMLCATDGL